MEGKVNQNFQDQFLKLDNRLTTIYRIQSLERRFWGGPYIRRLLLNKLEKAEAIWLSEEPWDFTTYKHKFNKIVVPNRAISETGLGLKQAVPNKYSHLIDRLKLEQYPEMMAELEKKFGG